MITIHLFWFYGWNVLAYVGSAEPILLGQRYTRSRKAAEGLVTAQLRKAKRLFPERNVLQGSPRVYRGHAAGYAPNMSEDKCPAMGDLEDFLPVTSTEG